MQNIINMVDDEFQRYEKVIGRIEFIKNEIDSRESYIKKDCPLEIECLMSEINYYKRLIESFGEWKAERISKLEEVEKEASDVYASWNGTIVKDDDNDDYVTTNHRSTTRRGKKIQMPCNNRTYKDMRRNYKGPMSKDLRKKEKDLTQRLIENAYSDSFRSGYRDEFLIK